MKNNVSCSTKELQEWVKAGVMDPALLLPEMMPAMLQFVADNKEMLYKHYQDPDSELTHTITLPPPDKWATAYELHVIDKKTGKVVSTMDLMTEVELLDGVWLRVKASELASWQKEAHNIKQLTKAQNEDLKNFIATCGSSKPLTQKEIATAIKEIQKKSERPRSYKQSAHLMDQKLKYQRAGSIDLLSAKRTIGDEQVEIRVEGIRLTEPESKIEHALTKLLRDSSQHKSPSSKDYYLGNEQHSIVEYGGEKRSAPVVKFKRADLYKAYLCSDTYSGSDALYIDKILRQYADKKFLIKYDRIRQVPKGSTTETRTDRIEAVMPVIMLLQFFPSLTNDEKAELDAGNVKLREEREEIIVAYSPIFIDQIDTKYVEFPDDTNRRLVIAAGGHKKVTLAMRRLMEWCVREKSLKRSGFPINEDNLISMLGLEKYAKSKRKKILNERIQNTIDAITNMGLITNAERTKNKSGNAMWIFTINTKYK